MKKIHKIILVFYVQKSCFNLLTTSFVTVMYTKKKGSIAPINFQLHYGN